jgi:uncharacterized protein
MKEFLEFVAKNLVDNPEGVTVEEIEKDGRILFRLHVDDSEMGKIIGKEGRNVKAIRVLLSAVGAKNRKTVELEIPDKRVRTE